MQQSPTDHDDTEPTTRDEVSEGQVSEGPSGLQSVEGLGGADAVPETPDNVPADRDLDIRSGDGAE